MSMNCSKDHKVLKMSVILPVYNAEKWLDETLRSVLQQSFEGQFELSIYNDASTDSSLKIIETWTDKLQSSNIQVKVGGHASETPRGVGYAKNRAVEQSSGNFLCFLDADDIMHKDRLCYQYEAAKSHLDCIIGSQFVRDPPGSTERFTKWANEMAQEQLITQAYTSHGPTVIMPTWFCSRAVYNRVGGFNEGGKGTPEDLMFFYKHLELGGGVYRVDRELITYRYHQEAATFSVHEETIWKLRVKFLQQQVISKWQTFTIWNAGKQGRKLYRSLSPENQKKVFTFKVEKKMQHSLKIVCAFCDVDEKKISKQFYIYEESKQIPKPKIPILHFKDARPPFIICMKLGLTGGEFERNLQSLGLEEGKDFFHFN